MVLTRTYEYELVRSSDAGAIRLDVRGREGFIPQTTFIHRSVEPLTPEVVAYFKEEYPKTFSRAVKRPLNLAGPADVQYKGIGFIDLSRRSPLTASLAAAPRARR